MEKIHVAHDIVISDFAEWRDNFELLGPVVGKLDIPIPNDESEDNSEVCNTITGWPDTSGCSLGLVDKSWVLYLCSLY